MSLGLIVVDGKLVMEESKGESKSETAYILSRAAGGNGAILLVESHPRRATVFKLGGLGKEWRCGAQASRERASRQANTQKNE